MSERGRSKRDVQAEILSYFLRHPKSADTLEGVARWRLREERIFTTVEETQEAIDWLIAEKYLERIATGGPPPLYGINRNRQREAEEFLKKRDTEFAPKEEAKVEITLTNRSPYLLIVPLNSGTTVHLAPGQSSGTVDDLEVNGSLKVEKLVNNGHLSLQVVKQEHAAK